MLGFSHPVDEPGSDLCRQDHMTTTRQTKNSTKVIVIQNILGHYTASAALITPQKKAVKTASINFLELDVTSRKTAGLSALREGA